MRLTDPFRSKGPNAHLAILIYHQVLSARDEFRPGVMIRSQFEKQMAMLSCHFKPISLVEGLQRLEEGKLAPRSVCVTFDDGYADNLSVAAPILEKFEIPATVFVAPGFLDGGIMWNDRIIEAVRLTKNEYLEITITGTEKLPLKTFQDKHTAITRLLELIKHLPIKERLK